MGMSIQEINQLLLESGAMDLMVTYIGLLFIGLLIGFFASVILGSRKSGSSTGPIGGGTVGGGTGGKDNGHGEHDGDTRPEGRRKHSQ